MSQCETRVTGSGTFLPYLNLTHTVERAAVDAFLRGIPSFPSFDKMAGVFSYESSEVDWCEDNYKHSENVVEYFNTMSSFIFFVISPIMLYLLHPYAKERNLAVHLVWIMMVFVGLFSMYFHMTLSFMGQMLDELSILWVLAIGYSLWFPRRHFPSFVKDSCTDERVLRLAWASTGLWVLAISCWISDRFGCSFWQKLDFCYLHGIWHILIVVATAYGSTLIAYLDASLEIPYSLPDLQYWPRNNWAIGLPYIVLKGTTKTRKRC
ncbi:alkaline ceramidase 1 isoform X3 [Ctenopharyngodon idella]|uniref:alkaline ceramidase 1 isoform X3 n=1 Tax=Ctenopharyngodon idella TaxID=7959 RepID=UPI00222FA7B8|nr:alkaline ceramidase 1 isoform X3 [Ctenopharyngodon idella]